MNRARKDFAIALIVLPALCAAPVSAQETTLRVDLAHPGHPIPRTLTGSCIEDVNHEIYGGIYSQMVFGESFQEPAQGEPVKGMVTSEGRWTIAPDGALEGAAGGGPKLLHDAPPFANGQVGVDLYLPGTAGGNAGLVVRTARAGVGADNFDGYEISIDVDRKMLRVGRHRHDFRLLKEAPCDVAPDQWIQLSVKLADRSIEVSVNGKQVVQVDDPRPLPAGTIGLRQWQRPARYRKLWVAEGGKRSELPFEPSPTSAIALSGMWRPVVRGTASLAAQIETTEPFVGGQSQRIEFTSGTGEAGIENRGLNRQGMHFAAGRPYDGYLWARAKQPARLNVTLESADGARVLARAPLAIEAGDVWRRYEFSLTPGANEGLGRLAITMPEPGSVVLGHVFLQPGPWGRFKNLPLRRDVVEGLINHGVTVMRYGGSMVNAPEYRWKKMIGPRDRRPPYVGNWYPYSSNGWGIIDFLDLCEAAGFMPIPDLNVNESAQDLADFVEYVNGPSDSEWGKKRAADGHPAPYNLRHIELGNEERVNDAYYQKFEAIARAVWAKDRDVTLVVGDFQYEQPITDPMNIRGAASRITSLAAHQRILDLAKQNDREVWFDVHVWTEGPGPSPSVIALSSYIDAIDKLASAARHKVAVFELNANNHDQRRALANAAAIGAAQRDGRLPVVTSANALQVDRQNDNGWDQGLLFLNPSGVWLQPPGYVTQMIARSYQPKNLDVKLSDADGRLQVTAAASEDGHTLVLRVVNRDPVPRPCRLQLTGFTASAPAAQVEELAADLTAANTATTPDAVKPRQSEWKHGLGTPDAATYTFPPNSFTVLKVE